MRSKEGIAKFTSVGRRVMGGEVRLPTQSQKKKLKRICVLLRMNFYCISWGFQIYWESLYRMRSRIVLHRWSVRNKTYHIAHIFTLHIHIRIWFIYNALNLTHFNGAIYRRVSYGDIRTTQGQGHTSWFVALVLHAVPAKSTHSTKYNYEFTSTHTNIIDAPDIFVFFLLFLYTSFSNNSKLSKVYHFLHLHSQRRHIPWIPWNQYKRQTYDRWAATRTTCISRWRGTQWPVLR